MEGSKSTFKINNNQCNRLRVSLFKNISIICNHQILVTELGGCCSGKQLGVSSSAGGHTSYLPPEIYRLHTGTAIVHSTLITCFAKSANVLCLKGQHQKKVWDHENRSRSIIYLCNTSYDKFLTFFVILFL